MTFTRAFRYNLAVGESAPFSEIAAFVDRAREAGAGPDTAVRVESTSRDASIVDHLLIELDNDTPPAAAVRIPVAVIQQLRDLLAELSQDAIDKHDLEPHQIGQLAGAHQALISIADGNTVTDLDEWISIS